MGAVSRVMAASGVRVWVAPGAELMPVDLDTRRLRFTRFHRWLNLGVAHGSVLAVAEALSLDPELLSVETHGGLRIFFGAGWDYSAPENYREPYIEIMYYRDDGPLLANHCCACHPRVPPISACTKKTCACLTCVVLKGALEPLQALRIDDVAILGPQAIATLLINPDADDIHPLAKALL